MHTRDIEVFEDSLELGGAAAREIRIAALASVAERGAFVLSLAGGSTPRLTYNIMADDPSMPWSATLLVFGDERCVPPEDERSNFRMLRETFLDRLGDEAPGALRMRGELDPTEAAAAYERELRERVAGDPPAIDLVLLGLGEDGHTASLFPGDPLLEAAPDGENAALVAATWSEETETRRLTLTPRLLRAARERLFLVDRPSKAPALARALAGAPDVPAALVGPSRWFITLDVAAALPPGTLLAAVRE